MKIKSLFIPLVVASAIGLVATPAWADWAAITYSPSTGKYGSASQRSTAEEATKSALNTCGESDCDLVVADNNTCIAVAVYDDVTGAGSAKEYKSDAEKMALDSCNSRARGYCKVLTSLCSD
ncbi:MAG: hypothetical protein BWK78_05490 [Thiotrichaceae bacterium IS1]|nr:MAG: hypothetical protein BWK78_05490 [Thiotrichaceae bacterium IS1]